MPTVTGVFKDTCHDLEKELSPLVERVVSAPEEVPLQEIEEAVLQGLVLVARGLTERLCAVEASEGPQQVPSREQPGAWLDDKGLKDRTVLTSFGPVTYSRRYYRNASLDESRWPRDEELGLVPREKLSPCLQELATYLSTVTCSYDQGVQVLARLRGVDLEYKQAQREVLRVAGELEEAEDARIAEVFSEEANPDLPWEGVEWMVVGTDGITVPHCAGEDMEIKVGRVDVAAFLELPAEPRRARRLRERQEKEGSKRRRETRSLPAHSVEPPALGPAELHPSNRREALAGFKESQEQQEYGATSKLVKRSLQRAFPDRRRPRLQRSTEQSTYRATARLGSERIGQLLWLAAKDRGLGANTRVVYLSDGGLWCRTVAETHFPQAVKILDVFHLARHVIRAANALHRAGSAECERWRETVLVEILRGDLPAVLEALQTVTYTSQAKREAVRLLVGYLKANADRLDYPTYVEAGYPVGSGLIEGACRHVIGERMKGSGKRWDDDGADAIARLRALECGGEWEATFRNRREARRSPPPPLRRVA